MNRYLYKQFFRNKAFVIALLILFIAGLASIYTGKNLLDRNQEIIAKSARYQKESIAKNVKHHSDNMGLLLYYVKFNLVNETPKLAALNMGIRDLNPSIQGVTIRNLEEQKHQSDFANPANIASGNFDFSFVLVFLFPLVIIAFCYNLISEDQENGTWKLLAVQSKNLRKLIDSKLIVRLSVLSVVYFLLLAIAVIWIEIPLDFRFWIFVFTGWLYLLFWFALCRWIISFQKSSAQNALTLVICWVSMNFILPMTVNIFIQKMYPVNVGLRAQMEQREGYHNKWDEAKGPTMKKFHEAYPQFSKYKVAENVSSSYIWYYAMQHAGDMASAESALNYEDKMRQRNNAGEWLGYFLLNIHTQLETSDLAKTGLQNQLNYAGALQKFHENQRLFFYPFIFSGQDASNVDWNRQTVKTFTDTDEVNLLKILLPYLCFIGLLLFFSQKNFKQLC